jgi:hypothetical protein
MVDSIDRILPSKLAPLVGAEIILEPWRPEDRKNGPELDKGAAFTRHGSSDGAGRFEVGGTAAPGKYDATITIRHPGFEEVQTVFRHDRRKHQAIVVLVRRPQP